MPVWSDHVPSLASARSLNTAIGRIEDTRAPGRILVTGTDSVSLARLAMYALHLGWQVAFPAGRPDVGRWEAPSYSLKVVLDFDDQVVEGGQLPQREGTWDVAMSTSGTTGNPRTYGFTLDQIGGISALYREAYRLDPAAHIVTALPAAHNFAFVAGVCSAAEAGASMVFAKRHEGVVRWLRTRHDLGRVVILASPVLLEREGLHRVDHTDLLVDSGAAPVSRPYLLRLRDSGVDIREGYGTTETLSLTHFDTDGSRESAGTVGCVVRGVCCRIGDDNSVSVRSPFAGALLDNSFQPCGEGDAGWIDTGDLGVLDAAGRLRLVGRVGDVRLGGQWPRDILDDIGEVLGARTASVRCSGELVEIHVLSELLDQERSAVEDRVVAMTGLPRQSVSITASRRQLTYSLKLPRTAAGPT
ncbi:MAG TPA: AMP-binding protein [Acidothermaceae bacterium]|nr:AMP-binding protein [Acidothermaceae bacterium]